ncbi:MAG: ABC transporter ATP-binding protein [Planctomycetes bacterium]|nr:ABC transporter ATP-binding protein [Planctomycetota bacterium]
MNEHHELEEDTRARIDLSVWKQLWGYTRPYRKHVVLLCLFGAFVAVAEVSFPLVTQSLIDKIAAGDVAPDWVAHGLAYVGLILTIVFSVHLFIKQGGRIRTGVGHDIRRDGFDTLVKLPFAFFDQRPVGWLMARMTSDCDRLTHVLTWGVLDYVWGSTVMLGIAGAMLWMHWQLALLVLTVLPALAVISAWFQRRLLRTSRRVRKTNSRITASFNENLAGVRTSKLFGRGPANLEEFQELTREMHASSVANAQWNALYLPCVLGLGSIATAIALSMGGVNIVGAGGLTAGELVAFLAYSKMLFDPVHQMARWFAEMQMAQASAERVLGLIGTEPAIADDPARLGPAGTEPDGWKELEFAKVDFNYGTGNKPVLEGFDLRVRAGERIALVGATGGGKSTIVSLLCRFYEPTGGELRFGGVDYRRLPLAWLQSQLGIVLQTPHLFSGTIAENIRYGRLDATDEEVRDAARAVGADEFIGRLEDGYASAVGEGGNRLSTGEKQLISFARAIIADPRILVMDEATSSIDTQTESRIQRALETVLAGRTSFVIAHRLSTIRSADRILVIDAGKIVEEGDHATLLARCGRYHDLYTRQSLRESTIEDAGDGLPAPA